MSRGPGCLQQRILKVVENDLDNCVPWEVLRAHFPKEAKAKTFYRAVQGLKRLGRIKTFEEDGTRYVERSIGYGEQSAPSDEELQALLDTLPSPAEQLGTYLTALLEGMNDPGPGPSHGI